MTATDHVENTLDLGAEHLKTTPEVGGIGHSVRRKEDGRFIQGRGNYLDDITLPGMLHMAILRSPIAHGRIRSIDTSAAQAMEGVVAVVTGELMAAHNLAWMPTLSGDTQAVLATDKVRYQGQEVAAVIATDPYIARDALPLIEVDYEELQPITGPQQSLAEGAILIRDEKEGQTKRPPTPPSPRRPRWWRSARTTRARILHRWRRAECWRMSTRPTVR